MSWEKSVCRVDEKTRMDGAKKHEEKGHLKEVSTPRGCNIA